MLEIKSFAMVEGICNLLRISTSTVEPTTLRPERSKKPTPHAADSIICCSLTLFVHPSTTFPPTSVLHTPACLTTIFQPMAPLPTQLSKLRRHLLLDRILRASILFPAEIAASLPGMHLPATLDLSNFRSFGLAIPS